MYLWESTNSYISYLISHHKIMINHLIEELRLTDQCPSFGRSILIWLFVIYQSCMILFFRREAYPSITCHICNQLDVDTWLHILLNCKQQHIHVLITRRHDKVVWELRKLLLSNKISSHYILMNASTYNRLRQDNIVPTWLLPCTCGAQRCHCNARFKPNILCIIGHPYNHPPPKLVIQFI